MPKEFCHFFAFTHFDSVENLLARRLTRFDDSGALRSKFLEFKHRNSLKSIFFVRILMEQSVCFDIAATHVHEDGNCQTQQRGG